MGVVVDLCRHGFTARMCPVCVSETGETYRKQRKDWATWEAAQGRPEGCVAARYDGQCARGGIGGVACAIAEGDWIGWDVEVNGWSCANHLEREL